MVLSPTGKSEMVNFAVTRHVHGQIVKSNAKGNVQAEPLAKILAAIRPARTTVDFWSLHNEGAECDVIQTTDFEKITVGILLIEMNKVPSPISKLLRSRRFSNSRWAFWIWISTISWRVARRLST